jgi:hypothetical protein
MGQIQDWLAQSYNSASKPLNRSRAVNCFAEAQLPDAKSKAPVAVWGWPGTSPFATLADLSSLCANVMNDVLYVVGQTDLWQVNADSSVVNLGRHGAQGVVSIDNNGLQLVWVDGVTGWVFQVGGIAQGVIANAPPGQTYVNASVVGTIITGDTLVFALGDGGTFTTTATSGVAPGINVTVPLAAALPTAIAAGSTFQDTALTLAQITDPNFFPSSTVTFFDGYFCFVRNGTKQMFLSPLYGITPFNAALFASKEATSDLLLAIANSHEQLFLFGQKRIETWYDAGNAPPTFPFQRSDGALIQRGLGAIGSIVLEDNTLFWLGDDGMYYRLEGFQPQAVSNRAVEYQWSTYQSLTDCIGFSITLWGHKMVVLTFPTAQATWVLDLSTGRWHERESWIGTNADTSIGRWRVSWALRWFNATLLGDSLSGQIQRLNDNVYTDFGEILPLTLIGPPFHTDRRRVFMKRFEVDMETGVGLTAGPATAATQYCAQGVEATAPTELATAGALVNLPASFSTWLFSGNVSLPDDLAVRGLWFSNQASDTSPATAGVQIGIFNDASAAGAFQIVVRCFDASAVAIVEANYGFTTWTAWSWIGISCDTATQALQVYINDGTGDQALTPASITWTSSHPVANPNGQAWHIVPSGGP